MYQTSLLCGFSRCLWNENILQILKSVLSPIRTCLWISRPHNAHTVELSWLQCYLQLLVEKSGPNNISLKLAVPGFLFHLFFSICWHYVHNCSIYQFADWLDSNRGLQGSESDRSTNWATTTAHVILILIFSYYSYSTLLPNRGTNSYLSTHKKLLSNFHRSLPLSLTSRRWRNSL